jgi:hypothetical protein
MDRVLRIMESSRLLLEDHENDLFFLKSFFFVRQIDPIDQVFAIVTDILPSSCSEISRYSEAKGLERYEEMESFHLYKYFSNSYLCVEKFFFLY